MNSKLGYRLYNNYLNPCYNLCDVDSDSVVLTSKPTVLLNGFNHLHDAIRQIDSTGLQISLFSILRRGSSFVHIQRAK